MASAQQDRARAQRVNPTECRIHCGFILLRGVSALPFVLGGVRRYTILHLATARVSVKNGAFHYYE